MGVYSTDGILYGNSYDAVYTPISYFIVCIHVIYIAIARYNGETQNV